MRTLAVVFLLASAAAMAAEPPIGAHSGEIVEVPVWLSPAPYSGPSGMTSEGFELLVDGKAHPIDFFEVWAQSDSGVTCLLGFRRLDDEASR